MTQLLTPFTMIAETILTLGFPGILIGLWIEGIGIPFPGDAFLIFYGFAAARGQMQFLSVWMIAIAGYILGTACAFLLSRQLGEKLLRSMVHLKFFNPAKVKSATRMMDKYSLWFLGPGRLLPGIRSIGSYAAGMGQIAFWRFLLYTGCGAVLWVTTWMFLGYWFGEHMQVILQIAQTSLGYVGLLAMVVLVGFWLIRKKFRRV